MAKANSRQRIDEKLLQEGHFDTLNEARSWIMQGKIVVDGNLVTKAGTLVSPECEIHLKGKRMKYVGRAGYKLDAALQKFNVDVTGKVVLDAGACTGGFTDCLLKHGATLVYAVDVGFGQICGSLSSDPRVANLEKTNISDLNPSSFASPIDMATVDLSYLSLTKALPIIKGLFSKKALIICLIKPLFEGLEMENFHNLDRLREVLGDLLEHLRQIGIPAVDVMVSPIIGGRGLVEFLALIAETISDPPSPQCLTKKAMQDLLDSPPKESADLP